MKRADKPTCASKTQGGGRTIKFGVYRFTDVYLRRLRGYETDEACPLLRSLSMLRCSLCTATSSPS